ncbi:hypothetical protein CR513_34987, partial [Mucuna pruriens]
VSPTLLRLSSLTRDQAGSISAEIILAQSLPRETRPLPGRCVKRLKTSIHQSQQTKAESDSRHPSLLSDKVSQPIPPTQEKYVSPQPQPTELKTLPEHLKYAYLRDNQQFSVIIANNLSGEQEEKLLEVLKKQKKAIKWTLADLPRINPSICMHKILL